MCVVRVCLNGSEGIKLYYDSTASRVSRKETAFQSVMQLYSINFMVCMATMNALSLVHLGQVQHAFLGIECHLLHFPPQKLLSIQYTSVQGHLTHTSSIASQSLFRALTA